jgi:hypothetical protein
VWQGAFVRFSEEDTSNSTSDSSESLLFDHDHPENPAVPEPDPPHPATTPWIAFVTCDANATHASQVDDVFKLANDRGAVGAVRIISLCKRWAYCLLVPELASLLGMVKRVYYQSRVHGPEHFHTANGYLFYAIPGIRTGYSQSIRSNQH